MKKKILAVMLVLVMLVPFTAAFHAMAEDAPEDVITIYGMSPTLKEQISLNFYLIVPDHLEGATATLSYKYDKQAEGFETDIHYTLTKDQPSYDAESGLYKLTFPNISAKEMTVEVSLNIIDAEGTPVLLYRPSSDFSGYVFSYCVAYWARDILEGDYNDVTKDFAKALLNYGQSAQEYFDFVDEFGAALNDPDLYEEMAALTAAVETNSDFDKVLPENAKEDAGYYGFSLLMTGDTKIRVYFTNEVTAKNEAGTAYTVGTSGSYWYVESEGIVSKDLDETKTFIVTKDGTDYTFRFSPLSYANAILGNSASKEASKKLAGAIYIYSAAADAYFQGGLTWEQICAFVATTPADLAHPDGANLNKLLNNIYELAGIDITVVPGYAEKTVHNVFNYLFTKPSGATFYSLKAVDTSDATNAFFHDMQVTDYYGGSLFENTSSMVSAELKVGDLFCARMRTVVDGANVDRYWTALYQGSGNFVVCYMTVENVYTCESMTAAQLDALTFHYFYILRPSQVL